MTKRSLLLPGLRGLLTIGAELRKLRVAVERLADATEGKSRLEPTADAPEEPLEIQYRADTDYVHQYAVEQRLARTLGRPPTADELVRELDGEEMPPEDPRVVVGRRQPERQRQLR